jgi:ABC-2 type transport system ATP-binding protein
MTDWGLTGVTVEHGAGNSIDDLSIRVRPGRITAVVGGDGAGKTTTLRTLVGVISATRGRVDRPGTKEIGYMSAGPGLYRDLTVIENMSFAGTAYGLDRAELVARANDLIERIGLRDARDRLAGDLSGGMRQKLALGVAMIHSPRLLVLDEPTTGVDPVSRSELWRLIARTASDGAAILIATSYIDEAERAEEVVVLTNGRAIAAGTSDEIIAGTPGKMFVAGTRPEGSTAWRRGSTWRVWSADGTEVPGAEPARTELEDSVIIAELTSRSAWSEREAVGV